MLASFQRRRVNFEHLIAGWERYKNIKIKIFSNIHAIFLCTDLKIYINPNTKIMLKISQENDV